jgi:hypothetical protein
LKLDLPRYYVTITEQEDYQTSLEDVCLLASRQRVYEVHTRLEIEGNTPRNSSSEIVKWCFPD